MTDYRIEAATRDEWAARCLAAEAERDQLRARLAAAERLHQVLDRITDYQFVIDGMGMQEIAEVTEALDAWPAPHEKAERLARPVTVTPSAHGPASRRRRHSPRRSSRLNRQSSSVSGTGPTPIAASATSASSPG